MELTRALDLALREISVLRAEREEFLSKLRGYEGLEEKYHKLLEWEPV